MAKKQIYKEQKNKVANKNKYEKFIKSQILQGFLGALFLVTLFYFGIRFTAADSTQSFGNLEAVEGLASSQIETLRNSTSTQEGVDMAAGPQYVVFAFDGSRSIPMWEDTRAFTREMNSSGIKFSFTYFINPIYLLTKEEAVVMYNPPRHKQGASAIGYADSVYDANQRVEQIKKAHSEGNEIASHAVGHFDGTSWTHEEWASELMQFDSILLYKGIDRKNIIRGFRAPELGQNENLQKALEEFGYKYDTSKVGLAQNTPYKKNGLWELPVASIDYVPDSTPGLSMDYSIYAHQTGAVDTVFKNTLEWQKFYDETMDTYRNYFKANYEGNHAPVYIAHHFSKWNDGLYYEVMKDFAREVCVKKNVECVTYRELYRKLNTY